MPTDSPIGQEVYYFDSPNTRFRGLVRRQVGCTYDGLEIVGLTEVANELIELLAEVHASPRVMLDAHLRRRVWKDKPIASPGLCGIVAGVLQRFTPWPYPFAMRTAAERQLNTHEVQDAVVRLFDRLMDAPPITRPPDYAGQFLALVAQRRARSPRGRKSCRASGRSRSAWDTTTGSRARSGWNPEFRTTGTRP